MKKFKQLWYMGLSIVGIPVVIVFMAAFFVIAGNLKKTTHQIIEPEKPKVDTVVVEKKVIIHDTVYIKPKIKPIPVVPVKDSI